jgi:hypothetical protein
VKRDYFIPSVKSEDFSKLYFFKNQGTCNIGAELVEIENVDSTPQGFCGAAVDGNAAFCLSGTEDLSDLLEGNILNLTGGGSATIDSCISIDKGGDCPGGLFYICNISGFSGSECVESLDCPDGTQITECPDSDNCFNNLGAAVDQIQAAS